MSSGTMTARAYPGSSSRNRTRSNNTMGGSVSYSGGQYSNSGYNNHHSNSNSHSNNHRNSTRGGTSSTPHYAQPTQASDVSRQRTLNPDGDASAGTFAHGGNLRSGLQRNSRRNNTNNNGNNNNNNNDSNTEYTHSKKIEREVLLKRKDESALRRKALKPCVAGAPVMASPRKRGLGFTEFPHMHSEFDIAEAVKAAERKAHINRMAEITRSEEPIPFSPRSVKGASNPVDGKMSFGKIEYAPDPYEDVERSRRSTLRPVGLSAGQPVFRAGGSTKDRYLLRRGDIHQGLSQIGRLLQHDWMREFDSIIMAKSGTIVIRFGLSSRAPAIIRYMNYLMRTNETVTNYGLRKDVHRWATKEDISLCFAVKPPWTSAPKYSGSGVRKGGGASALPPVQRGTATGHTGSNNENSHHSHHDDGDYQY